MMLSLFLSEEITFFLIVRFVRICEHEFIGHGELELIEHWWIGIAELQWICANWIGRAVKCINFEVAGSLTKYHIWLMRNKMQQEVDFDATSAANFSGVQGICIEWAAILKHRSLPVPSTLIKNKYLLH